MAAMASVLQHPVKDKVVVRKTPDYAPSYWGDFFINFTNKTKCTDERESELKEEVKKMLLRLSHEDVLQEMNIIDAIQRLGIGYLFEEPIDAALKRIHVAHVGDDYNLYFFSLHFKLLRQAGYNVSSDGFNMFKAEDGKFKESLSGDAKGLLSMYEAAYLGIPGEEILDEAIAFARDHLKSLVGQVSASLTRDIELALDMPTRRSLVRARIRQYISVYEMDEQHNDVLLELAKFDYNRLQRFHQEELKELTLWWNKTRLTENLTYARDKVVECYIWALGACYKAEHGRSRVMMAKTELLMTLADDTYDSFATFKEIKPFNEAIQRWDMEPAHDIPECMKFFLVTLFDTFSDFEEELREEGNAYRVDYLRIAMKGLCQAYYDEFIWNHNGYIPKFNEHLKISSISVGYVIIHCLFMAGMGEIVTKEALDWVINIPKITSAAGIICRLLDDMKPDKIEKEYIPTTIQCYAMDHGITEEEAKVEIRETIMEHEWKRMNEALLKPDPGIPLALHMLIFNMVCVMGEAYKRSGDGYNNAVDIEDVTIMMLIDPATI